MAWLAPEDHQRVSGAVAAAEARTAGEIVTVVADRSDGYSDIALVWAALVAFTALTVYALFPEFFLGLVDRLSGGWGTEWSPSGILVLFGTAAMLKFFATWLLLLWTPLRFALIPGPVKTQRTLARAIDLFKVGAERRTHGRTGVLIYLSMREHRAHIVADEAIASQVTPEIWGDALAAMLVQIKAGRCADGMIAAVEQVGAVLAEHFPRAEDDQNELPDRLIEL
ncbi:MAG TPA: TPM domain-containing protein [Croceibacterium sp.]|nr:TPM domain-containing protein [Croceibacterium sp.]